MLVDLLLVKYQDCLGLRLSAHHLQRTHLLAPPLPPYFPSCTHPSPTPVSLTNLPASCSHPEVYGAGEHSSLRLATNKLLDYIGE